MNHLSRLSLPVFGVLVGGFVLSGHTPIDTSLSLSARFKTEKVRSEESAVQVTGASGIAVFQDIQVPLNEEAGLRADGRRTETELQDHQGLPLIGGIEYKLPLGQWGFASGLELMNISSTAGPAETQSSSYNRTEVHLDWQWRFDETVDHRYRTYRGYLGLRTAARRSAFRNVSTGHNIDAMLLGIRGGWKEPRSYGFEAYGSFAPVANFAYASGRGFGGDRFQGSSTSLMETGVVASVYLATNAWLDIGLEQESAQVKIDDITEYNSFGLGVPPTARQGRQFDLATTLLRVGFHKDF